MEMRIQEIASPANQKIKDALKLRDSKGRKKTGLFIVEGLRESMRAFECGFELQTIFFKESLADSSTKRFFDEVSKKTNLNTIFSLSDLAYKKLALRESTENIICTFKSRNLNLEDLNLEGDSVAIVLDGIEKPGNMGAIFRSCDGAGVKFVFVTGNNHDIYSPNAIRSSVGAIFNLRIIALDDESAFEFLNRQNFQIFGAALSDLAVSMYESDLSTGNTRKAICLGTEADGLSDFWLKHSQHIIIPMRGISDSLNVSVAAAILIYESTNN
jgi:RNA methyltransferase, TrmH family